MSTTAIVLVVLSGVAFLVLMLVFVPRAVFAVTRRPLEERVRQHPPGDVLRSDLRANFFGVTSRGAAQMRGLGALVLTRDALHFHMLLPRRDLRIPLTDVQGTERVTWHLGKSVGRDLLKVTFRADGQADSVAWWVPDPQGWQAAIEGAAATAAG